MVVVVGEFSLVGEFSSFMRFFSCFFAVATVIALLALLGRPRFLPRGGSEICTTSPVMAERAPRPLGLVGDVLAR